MTNLRSVDFDRLVLTQDDLRDRLHHPNGVERVQTVNLHHLALSRSSSDFAMATQSADILTADGWPLVLLARAWGHKAHRTTGSDYVQNLLREPHQRDIALLGSSPSSGASFRSLAENAGHRIVFSEHGDKADWEPATLARDIAATGAHILLIAVTPPHGELLSHHLVANLRDLKVPINIGVIGVGGSIDMLVGEQSRAPRLFQTLGLEWAYRLVSEPKRLARRYLLECLPAMFVDVFPGTIRGIVRRL